MTTPARPPFDPELAAALTGGEADATLVAREVR